MTDNLHLFVYDAEQTRAAVVPGGDDIVLFCTCGLPQHNQHHLNGYDAVDELLTKKWTKHNEERLAILALEKLAMRLYYAEHYPEAAYLTFTISTEGGQPHGYVRSLHDKDRCLVEDDPDEPGWLNNIIALHDYDEGDLIVVDLATWWATRAT